MRASRREDERLQQLLFNSSTFSFIRPQLPGSTHYMFQIVEHGL
jgi:hypothetical protein